MPYTPEPCSPLAPQNSWKALGLRRLLRAPTRPELRLRSGAQPGAPKVSGLGKAERLNSVQAQGEEGERARRQATKGYGRGIVGFFAVLVVTGVLTVQCQLFLLAAYQCIECLKLP